MSQTFNKFNSIDQNYDTPHPILTTATFILFPQIFDTGSQHTCRIFKVSLICFGYNKSGQTNVPLTSKYNTVSVATGHDHSCNLNNKRLISCWGSNYQGQIFECSEAQNDNKAKTWLSLSAGGALTCGIDGGYTPVCWGKHEVLKQMPENFKEESKQMMATQVSAGQGHLCFISHELVHEGEVDVGEMETHRADRDRDRDRQGGGEGSRTRWGTRAVTRSGSSTGTIAGQGQSFGESSALHNLDFIPDDLTEAVTRDAHPSQSSSAVADQPSASQPPPKPLPSTDPNPNPTPKPPALTLLRRPHCHGQNQYGQTAAPSHTLTSPGGTALISAGTLHTCAILYKNNALYCWGYNRHEQTYIPKAVREYVSLVSAGAGFSCASKHNKLKCWGKDDADQTEVPEDLFEDGARWVSVGKQHACGLRAEYDRWRKRINDDMKCWGRKGEGQTKVPQEIIHRRGRKFKMSV